MQYITQCVLAYGRSQTTRTLRVHHATTFLFQIVKEQPKCLSSREEALNTTTLFQGDAVYWFLPSFRDRARPTRWWSQPGSNR